MEMAIQPDFQCFLAWMGYIYIYIYITCYENNNNNYIIIIVMIIIHSNNNINVQNKPICIWLYNLDAFGVSQFQ